ncbi:NERD domain-containing protein [Anaerotignum propionicum]|uniref:NERD domain-containing protein n=1 Tax=Anaerotignum propionicum TaxID=28446 RepID=UPI00210C8228|nr:NERD domain-containing protein [Anaerotignum propionicum]MCQ4936782.1 NERD domain-containing protein [Anaerotignum propionicum]
MLYFYLLLLFLLSPFFLLLVFLIYKFLTFQNQYNKSVYKTIVDIPKSKVFFDKGYYGEYLTVRCLEGISEKEKFLPNVYLNKAAKEGQTTEIDVVYINEYGIFVLESKNYSGWIFGNDKAKNWTQSLNKRVKNKFYNPVFQNAGHISALKATLGSRFDNTYKSIIVFSERCELKNVTVQTPDVYVIKRNNIRKIVQSLSRTPVLTEDDISEIYSVLSARTKVDEELKQKHIEDIKNDIVRPKPASFVVKKEIEKEAVREEKRQPLEGDNKICPKCGAHMVLRIAQKGANKGAHFWGCSKFPKCRAIEQVEEKSNSDIEKESVEIE